MQFIKKSFRVIRNFFVSKKKKLCYDNYNKRVVRPMEKKKNGIFEAKDLACYIKAKYSEYTNETKKITPIKMQKSLYLLFAYWAGFVNKGKSDGVVSEEENDILFDDKFEAWAYGPVVPTVYFNERLAMFFRTEKEENEAVNRVEVILNDNPFLKETLDSLLTDIFEISDFKLVSISHMDKSWQNHFRSYDSKHNEEIPQQEIIDEYTSKKFD